MMLAVLQLVLALLHTTTIATTTATSTVAATTSLIFPGQHHKIAASVRCIDSDCTQARSDANRCMTNTNTFLDTAYLPSSSSSPIILVPTHPWTQLIFPPVPPSSSPLLLPSRTSTGHSTSTIRPLLLPVPLSHLLPLFLLLGTP